MISLTLMRKLKTKDLTPLFFISGKQLTDLDGFALGVKNRELGILLVEAKDQRRGGRGASKRQIENTIDKLKFKTTHTPRITEIAEGAYCYLTIDGLK